jgi:hypothetical protein
MAETRVRAAHIRVPATVDTEVVVVALPRATAVRAVAMEAAAIRVRPVAVAGVPLVEAVDTPLAVAAGTPVVEVADTPAADIANRTPFRRPSTRASELM